ncbi:hypothetical protein O181_060067 [Austropuccinia psidii MF-1]|uniref:DUF202 domain-containing protein n=1 Tax=Austropuccinia psidii MF-1 TaxID=1389203 RepID=A0A9Q3EMV1_9BASI|nr:hypothetical protein [Austropuccinia psidii MF-1]
MSISNPPEQQLMCLSSSSLHSVSIRPTQSDDPASVEQADSHHQEKFYSRHQHLYRGHRSQSFVVDDIDELQELRARQRTFDGAYLRTAVASSVYALTILKVFDKKFTKIGLAYVALSLTIILISNLRRRRLNHDLSDQHFPIQSPPIDQPSSPRSTHVPLPKPTPSLWGRHYRTPGDTILLLTVVVAAVEISLIILILRLNQ